MFNFIRNYQTIFQNDYHFSFPTAKYESCNYSVSLLALHIVNSYGYICLYNYVCMSLLYIICIIKIYKYITYIIYNYYLYIIERWKGLGM